MQTETVEVPLCVLCGEKVEPWPGWGGFGHNPDPLGPGPDHPDWESARACDRCNNEKVIPERLRRAGIGAQREGDNA